MPVTQGGGGSGGATVRNVATLPDVATTKLGDLFLLTEDDDDFESGDLVRVSFEPTAATLGAIVREAVTDGDFRENTELGANNAINYVGAVSAIPATPAAGIENFFWDLTDGRTLQTAGGSGATAVGIPLKAVASDGFVYASGFDHRWFDPGYRDDDVVVWIGDPDDETTGGDLVNVGDGTTNTEAALITLLDSDEAARTTVEATIANVGGVVLFEIANDNLYKVTQYSPGVPAGRRNVYTLVGSEAIEFVDDFPDVDDAEEGVLYVRNSIGDARTLKITQAQPVSYSTEEFDSTDDADFLGIIQNLATQPAGTATQYLFDHASLHLFHYIPSNWQAISNNNLDTFLPADHIWMGESFSGVANANGAGTFANEASALAVFTDEPGSGEYGHQMARTA